MGKRSEAVADFNEIADSLPEDIEVTVQVGLFSLMMGDVVQAKAAFQYAVTKEPDNPLYLSFLANTLQATGEIAKAAVYLHKAIEIEPENVSALVDLSSVYFSIRQYGKAEEYLQRALTLQPKDANLLSSISSCLTLQGRYGEAIELGEQALKINRGIPSVYMSLGTAHAEMGNLEAAIDYYQQAIRKDKTSGAAYAQLAKVKKFTEADRKFIDNMEGVLRESLTPKARADIHFALGKIYDDLKQWQQAFDHYRRGNLLGKSGFDETYVLDGAGGPNSVEILLKLSKQVFTKAVLHSGLSGSGSAEPVFVVGMPRSGSTLTEQIISSHPLAAGAGELKDISKMAIDICAPDNRANFRAEWLKNLNHETLEKLAEQYLASLRGDRVGAQRIVDKMPDNYNFLGFIALLFPNAPIVHVIRNPVDTCLSCYFQRFIEIGWSYDLKHIAGRYRLYREAINYWQQVLPEGRIFEVSYENLTADLEGQSRQLIAACGLEWDPACLNFHEQDRTIATASLWQARQPIYKTSVRRWANYAPYIGDLLHGIWDYLDEEDRQVAKDNGVKPPSWLSKVFS